MRHARGIGRLGMLAVGLGIGAALAATPEVASADSSTDPFSLIDELLGGLQAPAQTTLDMQISIDGIDLFPTAGNTATALSGPNDIAIAMGANSVASAGTVGIPGQFDFAFANGAGSDVSVGWGNFDTGLASGAGSSALVGGVPGNLSSGDFGSAFGTSAAVESGANMFSAASGNDVAMVFDPFSTIGSSAFAEDGYFDLAAVFGDMLHASATGGNFLVDIL